MRLIDADKLLERMKKGMESGSNLNGTYDLYIEHAPTVKPTGDLISRQDALEYFMTNTNWHDEDGYPIEDWDDKRKLLEDYFNGIPSADRPTTDCTEFMEWLKAEVLDENNWELNAVAYGEIICRKLKKLGWIDVKDGCYVDTRPTGEWQKEIKGNGWNEWAVLTCDQCGAVIKDPTFETNYCPSCGAKMGGVE